MKIILKDKAPKLANAAYVAENASIIGNVELGKDSSVWFSAVVRGDENKITVGARTNIQDLCVLHVQGRFDTVIGDDVTIGHRAIVHGCHVGNRVLIGMGAVIMNGVVIGDDCIIGAGALVTEGQVIPPRSLVIGFPAKVKRQLTDEDVALIKNSSEHYVRMAKGYVSTM